MKEKTIKKNKGGEKVKFIPKFKCCHCDRLLQLGEELQADENSFYCNTCPEFIS